jgi:hypothetical protein
MLSNSSKKLIKSLHNFTIYVNNENIKCNKAFSCCLSQAIFKAVFNELSIEEFHFKNIQNQDLFISFFNILCEESFQTNNYSNRELIECLSIVGSSIEIPYEFQDCDEINWFLSLHFSKSQNKLYNKCIKIVATDFQKFPTEYLQNLSAQTLETVFTDNAFIRPSEKFLFNLLNKDKSKFYLLKFVNLFEVNSTDLKYFLDHLEVNEVDFELFENIKQLLFFNQNYAQSLQKENSQLKEQNSKLATFKQKIDKIISQFPNENSPIKREILNLQIPFIIEERDKKNLVLILIFLMIK